MNINVRSMVSSTGGVIPNQFIIEIDDEIYYQSCGSIIARWGVDGTTLDAAYWDYSKATRIYREQFLGEDTRTTKRKIEQGIYKLEDLNI